MRGCIIDSVHLSQELVSHFLNSLWRKLGKSYCIKFNISSPHFLYTWQYRMTRSVNKYICTKVPEAMINTRKFLPVFSERKLTRRKVERWNKTSLPRQKLPKVYSFKLHLACSSEVQFYVCVVYFLFSITWTIKNNWIFYVMSKDMPTFKKVLTNLHYTHRTKISEACCIA